MVQTTQTLEREIHQDKRLDLSKYKIKRVVAYARVSSDKDEALNSLDAQITYYEDYIKEHQGWEFDKVYVDEGISGTKENRPGFMQMMEDARAGKIDIILTKSITRFARNTVILLDAVRELKRLGIDVYFEKENVHTLSIDGELMLTVLATFAEEEARSASLNQLWRIRKMFEAGRPTPVRLLGYYMEDEQLYIIPEEAEIVRRIYKYYLEGMGHEAIVKKLEKSGIKTINGCLFKACHIKTILSNEKYAGNLLLQKSYRENFRTKKIIRNKGEKQMYFVEDTHEAIIDKETWEAVKKEIARRESNAHDNSKESHKVSPYPFTGMIICNNCHRHFRHRNRNGKYVWMCSTYLLRGKEACPMCQIPEDILVEKTKEAIKTILPKVNCDNITCRLVQNYIVNIVVPERRKLIFNFKNGANYSTEWDYKSRRESWTPEMKEKARQRAIKQHQSGRLIKDNSRKEAK